MSATHNATIPMHDARSYESVGKCIYCGSLNNLTKEHIIPLSMGGRWVLPAASCESCAAITGAFEGQVARTIIGPLRMLYDMPSRRKKDRPQTLPLKVKYASSSDWEVVDVDRNICPFLVSLPLYPLPNAITGNEIKGGKDAATSKLWIRGAGFWRNRDTHLQWLCEKLGVVEVMPTATVQTEPFCLMLAKVAHSFAVAELGVDGFLPYLTDMIRTRDLTNCAHVIGGGRGDEDASTCIHDLDFDSVISVHSDVIVVRVRILGILETPTYFVAVGLKK